ncbi:hypothetical protein FQ087_13215 [Sporosarcina sp. ANT_H38]|uniref:hypothetical protein n=1 Tax=Sporosarcina sp. ANT_H38 TaxID=2597358 RepID=UPI0011F32E3F|nr:hypothetical protein [Sporosarcina sp. ANT_H38]KAA0955563.1 hypothetical protein FQ087_13215 [Sporosarcina sp. ANT_H38]
MKKIMRNVWEVLKQSAAEIKANWKFSQLVQGRSQKMKMYVLVYMNTGFFLVYASLCFISMLYILFGIIGGTVLGIKESPYWFFLFLLPVAALPFLYFVHNMWTSHYSGFKKEYLTKHSIQVSQEE